MRDGQQSLFATRMSQQTIDRLLPLYENAGFYIMEVWGGAVPDSVMRYLGESPWDRLRKASEAMKGKSLLSALSRGRNLFGYVPYPDSVLEGFYKEAIANGLNVMRIFDALNDIDNVRESIKMINRLGGIADGAVCYTVDPKSEPAKGGFGSRMRRLFGGQSEPEKIFTDEYFVEKALEMEALGAKIITLKDMAGLVNPLRAASIISKLKSRLKVPVDFHTHCTPGYGLASSVMAMIHGVDILDTNIWWFGGGSAAPAIELIYVFAQRLGIEVEADMEAVGKIRNELLGARRELAPFDLVKEFPVEFDPLNDTLPAEISQLFDDAIAAGRAGDEEAMLEACHAIENYFRFPKPNLLVKNAEVPGGMYSNMVAQLKALQSEDVLDDAMALIPKVRRDAGLVPLVTPTSQIVGSQAVFLALDRKKGNADYTNPEVAELGGMKLAQNDEEYLLLELLPNVATTFLRNKRQAEYDAQQAAVRQAAAAKEAEKEEKIEPITGEVVSGPMPGTVLEVSVKPGDTVKKGQKLLVYESMKMENDVEAEHDATVKRVFVKPGDRFAADAPMIEYQD